VPLDGSEEAEKVLATAQQLLPAGRVLMPLGIQEIAIEPNDPNNLYIALGTVGAARSFDQGANWRMITPTVTNFGGLAIGAPDSSALFINDQGTGLRRSFDKGDSWEDLNFEGFTLFPSREVRVAPNEFNTVYACAGDQLHGSSTGGILRTTDLGQSWHRFDQGIAPKGAAFGMAINAQAPEELYFWTRSGQIYGTRDGGSHWAAQASPLGTTIVAVARSSS